MKIIKELSWFFKLEWKRYTIGIVSLSVVGLLNLFPPQIMGYIVDKIANGSLQTQDLLFNLAYLIGVALAIYGLRFIWRMFIIGTAYHLGRRLRMQLFEHFTSMPPSFYEKYQIGDLMARSTNDINALVMFAGGGVMSAVDASVTAFVTLATMFFFISWQMTLVAILPLPFMIFATSYISKQNHQKTKQAQGSFSTINTSVQESVSSMKVIKAFGYQEQTVSNFEKRNLENYTTNVTQMKMATLMEPVVFLFVGTSYVLTLAIGIYFINQKVITIGNLITFMTYLDMLVWPLMAIGFLFNLTQRGLASYERIQEVLREESDIITKNASQQVENGDLTYAIESFSYDEQNVLQNISFTLKKGQTLGIVGPTGSGKTTLIKLLMRERPLVHGEIRLGKQSIANYALKNWRALIGYVPQDQWLFNLSVLENICFSNRSLPLEKVIAVTKICGVYEDIIALPNGFDTIVGERGVSLSGGQKQRLAMCRALISNPDILILDDSLSAVDAKTENHIIESLKQKRENQTTIISAHRLSAVTHADVIIVLEKGYIIEIGTHEQLLALKGWYYNTYQMQQLEME